MKKVRKKALKQRFSLRRLFSYSIREGWNYAVTPVRLTLALLGYGNIDVYYGLRHQYGC